MEKREEGYNQSETGNWNVAADYSKFKIMGPLYKSDIYENISKFGYDSLVEQLDNYNIPSEALRLMGLDRLIHELLKLVKNVKFAMKVGNTKAEIEGYEKTLKGLLEITPLLSNVKINQRRGTKETRIIEQLFNKVLNKALEIKSKINEPLNKNHLIFTDKEEFDPGKYKKQIIESATQRG